MSTLTVASMALAGVILTLAFSHRGLLLEQRSSINQYKAAQAFEAAEAGLEWAIARLNDTTPIDDDCRAKSAAAARAFRERYLAPDAGGEWAPRAAASAPSCARSAMGGWACRCLAELLPAAESAPSPAPGAPADLPATDANGPAFSVELLPAERPGQLRLVAHGCIGGGGRCTGEPAGANDVHARVEVLLARVPGLGSEPAAALTVRGSAWLPEPGFHLWHTQPSSGGMTLHAGGAIDAPGLQLTSAPGAPAERSTWPLDEQLAALTPEGLFASLFRMDKRAWKLQPVVRVIDCRSACDGALIDAAGGSVSQQLLWLDGGLELAAPLTLGTPERPVVLVVDGPVDLPATLTLHGLIYATDASWRDAAGASIHGAVVFESSLNGSGATQIRHDTAALRALYLRSGTFARVPGSWRDF